MNGDNGNKPSKMTGSHEKIVILDAGAQYGKVSVLLNILINSLHPVLFSQFRQV